MGAPTVSNKAGKTFVYGITAADITVTGFTGMSWESVEVDNSAQVDDQAIGEDGRVEADAVGGEAYSFSMSGYCVGTIPPPGTKVTIANFMGSGDSKVGTVRSVKPARGNRAYKKFTLTVKGFEGITY